MSFPRYERYDVIVRNSGGNASALGTKMASNYLVEESNASFVDGPFGSLS